MLSISDLDGNSISDIRVTTSLGPREPHRRREGGDEYEPASSSVTTASSLISAQYLIKCSA